MTDQLRASQNYSNRSSDGSDAFTYCGLDENATAQPCNSAYFLEKRKYIPSHYDEVLVLRQEIELLKVSSTKAELASEKEFKTLRKQLMKLAELMDEKLTSFAATIKTLTEQLKDKEVIISTLSALLDEQTAAAEGLITQVDIIAHVPESPSELQAIEAQTLRTETTSSQYELVTTRAPIFSAINSFDPDFTDEEITEMEHMGYISPQKPLRIARSSWLSSPEKLRFFQDVEEDEGGYGSDYCCDDLEKLETFASSNFEEGEEEIMIRSSLAITPHFSPTLKTILEENEGENYELMFITPTRKPRRHQRPTVNTTSNPEAGDVVVLNPDDSETSSVEVKAKQENCPFKNISYTAPEASEEISPLANGDVDEIAWTAPEAEEDISSVAPEAMEEITSTKPEPSSVRVIGPKKPKSCAFAMFCLMAFVRRIFCLLPIILFQIQEVPLTIDDFMSLSSATPSATSLSPFAPISITIEPQVFHPINNLEAMRELEQVLMIQVPQSLLETCQMNEFKMVIEPNMIPPKINLIPPEIIVPERIRLSFLTHQAISGTVGLVLWVGKRLLCAGPGGR